MKSVHRNLSVAWSIFVLLLVAEISFAQDKNPTVYPFGGVPDRNRSFIKNGSKFVPLSFTKALFGDAHFDRVADFEYTHFKCAAYFHRAHFGGVANFRNAHFGSLVHFGSSHFGSEVFFEYTRFGSAVTFANAQFDSIAHFEQVHFDSIAIFAQAHFYSVANFLGAAFNNQTDFTSTRFDSLNLMGARIGGKFSVGSYYKAQAFDFSRTIFLPKAKIVIHELVELNIQPEKFKYLSFEEPLDYFRKKNIIENLKSKSFANDKSAQFELDYIFAKSTMYQEPAGEYEQNIWYEICDWPKLIINTIYYWTMGLGYRPFRLIWWILATIIIYTAIFAKKIPGRINAYISNPDADSTGEEKKEVHLSLWETLLNCAYFSVMVFFTFRLKRDILTFFDAKEKRLIVGEWVVGFLVYVAFLTLSKSGSILHNLKELFVG